MEEVRNEILFGRKQVLMPYYTANRALEGAREPYSLDKILQTVFNVKYDEAIKACLQAGPIAITEVIGHKEAKDLELINMGKPRFESSWNQAFCHTTVDVEIPAIMRNMLSVTRWILSL